MSALYCTGSNTLVRLSVCDAPRPRQNTEGSIEYIVILFGQNLLWFINVTEVFHIECVYPLQGGFCVRVPAPLSLGSRENDVIAYSVASVIFTIVFNFKCKFLLLPRAIERLFTLTQKSANSTPIGIFFEHCDNFEALALPRIVRNDCYATLC